MPMVTGWDQVDLTPEEAMHVAKSLGTNVLPENRMYRYHHYNDNCSTRPRDIIDAAIGHGADTVVYDQGTTNIDFGPGTAGEMRLMGLLRAANIDGWAGVGDMPMGCVQTWGMFNSEGTADDWFRSDYIIVWSGNPVYTRIPEMHFMTEARYRGAKLIVADPRRIDIATYADLYLRHSPGTDLALLNGLMHILARPQCLRTLFYEIVKSCHDLRAGLS